VTQVEPWQDTAFRVGEYNGRIVEMSCVRWVWRNCSCRDSKDSLATLKIFSVKLH